VTAKTEYDCIIIGAGAAGAATAYQLSKRGKSVLLLEQFALGHDRGSSHGHSRIFRFAYGTLEYSRMAVQALQSWRALEADSGETLLTMTGGLDLGPQDSSTLRGTMQGMTAANNAFETLEALELSKRFPQWRIPNDWLAVHSVDAGILNPSQAVEIATAMARTYGATVLEHTTVTKIHGESAGQSPRVETNRGVFSAKKIVVTAGGWLPELFPTLRLPVQVTLEDVVYFRPSKLQDFLPERFPIFIGHQANADSNNPSDRLPEKSLEKKQPYGFPAFGLPGIKVGLHLAGPVVQASNRDYMPSEQSQKTIEAWLGRYLPGALGPVMLSKTCLYSTTPTNDFLIDTHAGCVAGGFEDVILASPCSGHGFKFMPLLGEMIADLVQGDSNTYWFERFQANKALLQSTV
jgi:sarcosine oxidase